MWRKVVIVVGVCSLAFSVSGAEKYLSPSAVMPAKDGKLLYIAEATAQQIASFDIASGKVTKAMPVACTPTGLALAADGKTLYVTGGGADGQVSALDTSSGKVTAQVPVGHTPMSPVLAPDGKTLYVCNRFNDSVSVIDLASKKEAAEVAVLREPVAAAVTPDGKRL